MSRGLPLDWQPLLAQHSAVVEEYMLVAGRISPANWMRPLAPGKWTPAEVTSHVAQAYGVLGAELAGAGGMKVVGSRLQRWLLRHTVMPRLLAGKPFPLGVRAPRETRPHEVVDQPGPAMAALSNLAEAFTRQLTEQAIGGTIHLTHAYFGPLSPRQGLQLLTVHTRHHARQLQPFSLNP